MKERAEKLKKAYESLNDERKKAADKLIELVDKWKMTPEMVDSLLRNTMKGDEQHPELESIEGMTSKEYADIYKQVSEYVAEDPQKYEKHAHEVGMNPDDLALLFSSINGVIEEYPEVWESREQAEMLHPKNLKILVDVFKKQ